MAMESPVVDRLLDTALDQIAAHGWSALTMADVAGKADVALAETYRAFPTRAHLLAGLLARTDYSVLAGPAADPTETPRDRLFDVLMRRFDALQAHRPAYLRLMRDLPLDPAGTLVFLPRFGVAMAWMLEAAGLSAAGPLGSLRCQGLALVYLNALRTWAKDDSPDMARTMASVDQSLSRIDALVRWLPGLRTTASSTAAPVAAMQEAADPSHDDAVPD